MYTKLPKTTKPTKNSFKRVRRDLCSFVIFVKKPWAVLVFSAAAMSGCASAQAKGKPSDRPALNVPAPPPRIIEPAEAIEPVGELPNTPSSAASRSTRPTSTKPPVSESKPEAKSGSEARPEAKAGDPPTPPVDPAPPPVPAAQLRTPQTADTSAAAKAVRATIDMARGTLNGVNFAPLSNVRKKAYNDAKLLLQQAEDAVKEGNLAFAQGLANKAETLAKELAGR